MSNRPFGTKYRGMPTITTGAIDRPRATRDQPAEHADAQAEPVAEVGVRAEQADGGPQVEQAERRPAATP